MCVGGGRTHGSGTAGGLLLLLLRRVAGASSTSLTGVGNPVVVHDGGDGVAANVTLEVVLRRLPLTTPGDHAGGRYLGQPLLRQGRVAGPGPAKSRHAGR